MERDLMIDFNQYMSDFEKCVNKYITPKDKWTPVDEAIFKPRYLYRIPIKEAKDMQLKSIKYSFKHHYENNEFYNNFCKEHNISSIAQSEKHRPGPAPESHDCHHRPVRIRQILPCLRYAVC